MFEDLAKIFTLDVIVSILVISCIFAMCAYMMIKYDTKRYKTFRDNIASGSEVMGISSYNSIEGIVTNVDDEWITVETKFRRHRIYPKSKIKK